MLIIKYENGVTVDDLVSENCTVHLERTDTKHWWMAIYDQAGNEAHVEFFDCTNVLVTLNRATEQRNEAEAGEHTCPLCEGSGKDPNDPDPSTCPKCYGSGQV